ncbi:MAG: translation initiation factor IF-2 [Candidatus Omnitrophica bacterium]|nr:translation initiation factor IF-2 [Candidatus Omnitrophota bacterium]MCM8827765.1 translation initiation factor IF-2 [Candidatus Omnitrophota bacterium]
MRVYQFAKQIKVSPKNLVEICEKAGIKGKTYVSGLKDDEIGLIKEYIKKSKLAGKPLIATGIETVGEIASKLGISASEIIKYLSSLDIKVSINDRMGAENIKKFCDSQGVVVEFRKTRESYLLGADIDTPQDLVSRAPVVTVMGHVDHGKTTILDFIRKSNVAAREYGQITQKIGAYKVHLKEGSIVFIDTPGHEVFTAMRARGAKLTDIAVLVIAADEGVKLQTIEAINHCKAASVPIIVAINKIDRPNANPEAVKKKLSEYGIVPEEWGGQNVFLNVSGVTGANINELLEIILLMGEMMELKANPERPGEGVVLESYLHKQKGPVINLLVQNGTVASGDFFVCGSIWGKVRAMFDENGKRIEKAGPSTPVELLGANSTPVPGDMFKVVCSEADARKMAEGRNREHDFSQEKVQKVLTLEDLQKQIMQGEVKEFNMILKTDSIGSQEAIKASIEKISQSSSEKHNVSVNCLHYGLGTVSESDILLAVCSNAIVFAYNVGIDSKAEKVAKQHGIEIKLYRLVYDLIEDIKNTVEGMTKPKEVEIMIGQALVKQVFKIGKNQAVAGCLIVDGKAVRDAKVKIVRNGSFVFEGFISSLKRFKNSVREVATNTECGIGVSGFGDFQQGDIIQIYQKVAEGTTA